MSERIAVIGLGYVGLPVAMAFADAFPGTVGFDIDAKILGCTSEGPGPISVLGVGENATITYRH